MAAMSTTQILGLFGGVIGGIIIRLIMAVIKARSTTFKTPKGLRRKVDRHAVKADDARDCTRETFREKKLPKDIDYVVIGSGMGGLYCAALLARTGRRVVVLEQHYVAGGCTHTFEDKGYEFDTGLHYVGRIEKYKNLLDLVSGGGRSVHWEKMGEAESGHVYDEVKLGSDPGHKFRSGEKSYVDDLVAKFPDEREGIEEYVRLCKKANKAADLYFFAKLFAKPIQWLVKTLLCGEYLKYAEATTASVVNKLIKDPKLRAILCGTFGNYGLTPEKGSFVIQAGIVAHYMDGGYYPVGGSQEISKALIPTIEAAGGAVFVKADVTEIIVSGNTTRSVRVGGELKDGVWSGGVVVAAKEGVISAAGAAPTHQLLAPAVRPKLGWDQMLSDVTTSLSHVYAFIGMKGTGEELGLHSNNLWVLPGSVDAEGDFKFKGPGVDETDKSKYLKEGENPWSGVNDGDEDEMLLFLGFPSEKDPSFKTRFPGKSTCCIISSAHPEWFERFYDAAAGPIAAKARVNQSGKRKNEEYGELKKALEAKFLSAMYRHYPKLKGKVDYVSIGSPLTNKYYLGRNDSYGLEHTPARYGGALDMMRPKTDIDGLWITGHDVGSVGIVGALNSGIMTAMAITRYGIWDLVVAKRNIIEDLMEMDIAGEKKSKDI